MFGNYQAGQSCISVQRVLVDRPLYDEVVAQVVAQVEALVTGDASDPATDVGPLVDQRAAERVASWIEEAVNGGAKLLDRWPARWCHGLARCARRCAQDEKLWCEEVFGPALVIAARGRRRRCDSGGQRLAVRPSDRCFHQGPQNAFRFFSELEVGGVIIGDVPSYRADQMPYGGVKESGVGREGVRYAMTDFS